MRVYFVEDFSYNKTENWQNEIQGQWTQTLSGRFVIVQMDNGEDALNLKEVKAFGEFEKSKLKNLTYYLFILKLSKTFGKFTQTTFNFN